MSDSYLYNVGPHIITLAINVILIQQVRCYCFLSFFFFVMEMKAVCSIVMGKMKQDRYKVLLTCACTCVCVCVCMHAYLRVHMCMCLCMWVCVFGVFSHVVSAPGSKFMTALTQAMTAMKTRVSTKSSLSLDTAVIIL